MIFERKKYLNELIAGRGNGLVKIIAGVRRCGKSFLLFDIWHNRLLEHGVTNSHIIEIQLDDFRNRRLRKPDALLDYIDSKVVDDGNPYYIVLDEVQLVEEFVEVILSLTHMRNVDVYVSGSNSRFLSSDVVTEFRGRGDEIRIWPLTFDEYFNGIGGDIRKAWLDYYTFGGLPQVALLETEEKKTDYLRGLYETTYLRDVIDMPTPEKEQQERRPLLSINDHFRKIVIVGDDIHRKEDELGVLTVGLLDFLTDKNLLEQG